MSHEPASARSDPVVALRQTIASLMVQITAQNAALKAMEEREEQTPEVPEVETLDARPQFQAAGGAVVVPSTQVRPEEPFRIKQESTLPFRVRKESEHKPPTTGLLMERVKVIGQSLNQRQEHLEGLDREAEQLETGSSSLAEMARELNQAQQQKKNKWAIL